MEALRLHRIQKKRKSIEIVRFEIFKRTKSLKSQLKKKGIALSNAKEIPQLSSIINDFLEGRIGEKLIEEDDVVASIFKEFQEVRRIELQTKLEEAGVDISLNSKECKQYLEKGTPTPAGIIALFARKESPRKRQKTSRYE